MGWLRAGEVCLGNVPGMPRAVGEAGRLYQLCNVVIV